jgi:hypothetical protein
LSNGENRWLNALLLIFTDPNNSPRWGVLCFSATATSALEKNIRLLDSGLHRDGVGMTRLSLFTYSAIAMSKRNVKI